MPKVNVDEAEEGMVVADDICGPNGQLLLPAGICITAKHLRVLKTWGIRYIGVEGDDPEPEADIVVSSDLVDKVRQNLAPRFQLCDLKHPVMAAIYLAVVKQDAIALHKGDVNET